MSGFNQLLNVYNAHKMKITLGAGVILGLAVGLLVGWVIWPTSYYNATPNMLRQDFRDDYLAWVARQYAANGDLAQAQERLGVTYWDESPSAILMQVAQERGGQDSQDLETLAVALQQAPIPAPGDQPTLLQRLRPALQVCGIGLIVVALAGLGYLSLSRMRSREPRHVSERAVASQQVEPVGWEELPPPVTQFKTTYTLGDDFYDPSFSIEGETGDFMGECGVGISEAIGVGDPKKVTAMEVWLFDKNDIHTVTKVLMSEFAFEDESLRAKLAAKGDLVPAEPGQELVLETATLELRARVVNLEYGQGQLPPQSFFHRLTLDLGVWIKPGAEEREASNPEPPIPPTI